MTSVSPTPSFRPETVSVRLATFCPLSTVDSAVTENRVVPAAPSACAAGPPVPVRTGASLTPCIVIVVLCPDRSVVAELVPAVSHGCDLDDPRPADVVTALL
jgi:hypothetical protein